MDEFHAAIGKRIREIRLRRGLSVTEVTRQMNLSRGYIGNLETGKTKARLEIYHSIATVLEVGLDVQFKETPIADLPSKRAPRVSLQGLKPAEQKMVREIVRKLRSRQTG